ncbi:tRNA pseudouridine(38-40) synthase TruA [Bacillus taeanensis]|uniref:tRNA pseudouridine synthase A n=1 Tax=Bacillus taeanensis TaxID=273032 RepID=A0A366XQJ8_9BACI|nr:tRNA pseudouridine(38-40) synthase TruA [Bacillus taeanensis]RBW67788.1 tRNA pseudouridine(38-40) synthase TruA [Bacillus taeanensis]
MRRLKALISYDGTNFSGYQVQPNARTIQCEVEAVLQKMHKGEVIRIHASGRTDAGVHAVGQVIHFDSPLVIDEKAWKKALNALLPDDIRILDISYVSSDFHARFSAVKKEYRYRVLKTADHDVFRRNYVFHMSHPLNIEAVQKALAFLEGTHDFSAFCAANTEVIDKIRTIYKAEIVEDKDELVFRFIGSGFLYNMVRILVGTLLEVGQGKRKPEEMKAVIESKSRAEAGKTAPGQGLVLWKVFYE